MSSQGTDARKLTEHAFALARSLEVETVLVQADGLRDARLVNRLRDSQRVIWLVADPEEGARFAIEGDSVVVSPTTRVARIAQIVFALFTSLLDGEIEPEDRVVCLSGVNRLDTILVTRADRHFPWFRKGADRIREAVPTRTFARVLQLALRFANEGREGKPVATIFVVGAEDALEPHLRQLILNPLAGHPRRNRNLYHADFVETLRELSALDGAIVVSPRGVVESAGTYLSAPAMKLKLKSGLGARHAAAAGITAATPAIAVAISESSGTVTVYHGGEVVLELESPGHRSGSGHA